MGTSKGRAIRVVQFIYGRDHEWFGKAETPGSPAPPAGCTRRSRSGSSACASTLDGLVVDPCIPRSLGRLRGSPGVAWGRRPDRGGQPRVRPRGVASPDVDGVEVDPTDPLPGARRVPRSGSGWPWVAPFLPPRRPDATQESGRPGQGRHQSMGVPPCSAVRRWPGWGREPKTDGPPRSGSGALRQSWRADHGRQALSVAAPQDRHERPAPRHQGLDRSAGDLLRPPAAVRRWRRPGRP